ncbi:MAG: hypothetical protein OXC66_09305 [Roseovarius sp.]|nr:hypothetical protein [Roseovarius sp.]
MGYAENCHNSLRATPYSKSAKLPASPVQRQWPFPEWPDLFPNISGPRFLQCRTHQYSKIDADWFMHVNDSKPIRIIENGFDGTATNSWELSGLVHFNQGGN